MGALRVLCANDASDACICAFRACPERIEHRGDGPPGGDSYREFSTGAEPLTSSSHRRRCRTRPGARADRLMETRCAGCERTTQRMYALRTPCVTARPPTPPRQRPCTDARHRDGDDHQDPPKPSTSTTVRPIKATPHSPSRPAQHRGRWRSRSEASRASSCRTPGSRNGGGQGRIADARGSANAHQSVCGPCGWSGPVRAKQPPQQQVVARISGPLGRTPTEPFGAR